MEERPLEIPDSLEEELQPLQDIDFKPITPVAGSSRDVRGHVHEALQQRFALLSRPVPRTRRSRYIAR